MEVLVEGLQERSRVKMMDELWRFITVDDHEAVKTLGSLSVLEPLIYCGLP